MLSESCPLKGQFGVVALEYGRGWKQTFKDTSPMIVSLPVDTLQLAVGFEPWAS
ncbi:MAG: hypothetical protein AAF572_18770 [Cyanobacteria bacterium P01_B01_bin.77]